MKIETAMTALLRAGNAGLITLEAMNLYGETCLNTSVSTMCHQQGLVIDGQSEPFTTRVGSEVRFTRYRLVDIHSRYKDQPLARTPRS